MHKLMKSEGQVQIHTNIVKSGVNVTILNVNEAIQCEEFKSNNETSMCEDKDKQTSSVYYI